MGKTSFVFVHVRFGKSLLKTIIHAMQGQVYRMMMGYMVFLFLTSVAVSVQGTASAAPGIATGGYHCLALMSNGTVWAWGDNERGQLGIGTTTTYIITPTQISNLSGVTAIAGGHLHSLFLDAEETVWACGRNVEGQVGDGTTTDRTTPVHLSSLSNIIAVAGGGHHSLALDTLGKVWVWGANDSYQLGDGTVTNSSTPNLLSGLGSEIIAIEGGMYHSLALASDGKIWAWGWNGQGQLGDGSGSLRKTVEQVKNLGAVTAVACGWYHNLAVKSDGTVWAWGDNTGGQLGDGTTEIKLLPVQVSSLSNVIAAAGGGYHSLALKSDGTVWAWGDNRVGQLGDGTTTNRKAPIQVDSLSGITAIACGEFFSVALKSDGTVWAWGGNSLGQLGDGTTATRTTPVQVGGLNLITNTMATPTPTPTPEGGYYEVEYQANTQVYQVLLIEDSTSEVLAGFDINERCEGTIQDYYTGGSSDQEFWLRIEENATGDTLKILSKFANQPIVRVVSCNTKKKKQEGRTGLPRPWSGNESGESGGPPDEWVDGGGTLGSEITNPYNQCDLEFAGFIKLRVNDKKGNRSSMKKEVLTPLKNAGLWAEDAVQLDRFKRVDDGYVAVISITTTYCAQKVQDSVTLQYNKASLSERSLVLTDND
ncbi:MAG: hypothetical protein FJ266_11165 [Planctomycetes bacterium]|nr:hypothetical protein [Planctomycetota bacterium]